MIILFIYSYFQPVILGVESESIFMVGPVVKRNF